VHQVGWLLARNDKCVLRITSKFFK